MQTRCDNNIITMVPSLTQPTCFNNDHVGSITWGYARVQYRFRPYWHPTTHLHFLQLHRNCNLLLSKSINYVSAYPIELENSIVPQLPSYMLPPCRNPTLGEVGGWNSHSQSWRFGVLRDSRMFRVQQQRPKRLALGCSWWHWKGLEA